MKMKVANLSQAALDKALADTNSASLLYVLRFSNGYDYDYPRDRVLRSAQHG